MARSNPMKEAVAKAVREGAEPMVRAAFKDQEVEVHKVDDNNTTFRIKPAGSGAPRYFLVKVSEML